MILRGLAGAARPRPLRTRFFLPPPPLAAHFDARRWMGGPASLEELAAKVPENYKPTKKEIIEWGPMGIGGAIGMLLRTFSDPGARDGHARLVTIGLSPFCEKARWALDISGIPYTEDSHPPFFSAYYTLPPSGGASSQVPMLVLPSGEVIWDSHRILRHLAANHETARGLYPPPLDAEVSSFERRVHERLGAPARLLAYNRLLTAGGGTSGAVGRALARHSSRVEGALYPAVFGAFVRQGILSVTKARREDSARLALQEIRLFYGEVSEMLSDGRAFLFGDHFTAADLTFAAHTTLLQPPSNLNALTLADADTPPGLLELREELSQTRAGRHAASMYREHRGRDAIRPESGPRDKWPFSSL